MDNIQNQLYPSLNQRSSMIDKMRQDKNLDMFDWDTAWEGSGKMTLKQYKYCLALWINENNHKLKEVLSQFIKLSQ